MSVSVLLARHAGLGVGPSPTGPLRGQFVIHGNYPYGPLGTPDTLVCVPNNRFFFQELDQVWLRDRALATVILGDAIRLGMNHMPAGPAFANGYAGDYPDTRYVSNPEPFYQYLEWLAAAGIRTSLFLFPDCGEYWLGENDGWNWDLIDRDLKPIYAHDRVRRAVARVVFGWEIWSSIDHMVPGYVRMRDWFPHHPREWHTGPLHHSPALSTESEEGAWRVAAEHGITGCMMQNAPPSQPPPERTPLDQLAYDLWDLVRRFQGYRDSPWGPPVLSVDGKPLTNEYSEAVAYDIYRHDAPDSLGVSYADVALTVEHITGSVDGIPTAGGVQLAPQVYRPRRLGAGVLGAPRGVPGQHGRRR